MIKFFENSLSPLIQSILDLLKLSWDAIVGILNYLLSLNVSISSLAQLLVLVGSVILILGVLCKSSKEVINDSIWRFSGHGMLTAIFFPAKIIDFLKEKNRVLLGLVLLCLGYILSVFFNFDGIKLKLISVIASLIIIMYLLSAFISGINRILLIYNWKNNDCNHNYLITKLLDKDNFYADLNKYALTNQSDECINNTIHGLSFIKYALDIDIELIKNENEKYLPNDVEKFQQLIKTQIDSTNILYYFVNPGKLLKSYI